MGLADEFVHSRLVWIGFDADVGVWTGGLIEAPRWVHPCDDAAMAEAAENLFDEEQDGLFILGDREFSVVEQVIGPAGQRRDAFVGMETGDELDAFSRELPAEVVGVGRRDGEDQVGMADDGLVGAEPQGFEGEEALFDEIARRTDEGAVIVVLDVAFAEDFQPPAQAFVRKIVARMQPLEKDGVIVAEEGLEQARVFAAIDIVGQKREIRQQSRLARVIMDFFTEREQLGRLRPFVFEAMQDEARPAGVEGLQFVVDVDDSAVVGRVRNVERDDVEVVVHEISHCS